MSTALHFPPLRSGRKLLAWALARIGLFLGGGALLLLLGWWTHSVLLVFCGALLSASLPVRFGRALQAQSARVELDSANLRVTGLLGQQRFPIARLVILERHTGRGPDRLDIATEEAGMFAQLTDRKPLGDDGPGLVDALWTRLEGPVELRLGARLKEQGRLHFGPSIARQIASRELSITLTMAALVAVAFALAVSGQGLGAAFFALLLFAVLQVFVQALVLRAGGSIEVDRFGITLTRLWRKLRVTWAHVETVSADRLGLSDGQQLPLPSAVQNAWYLEACGQQLHARARDETEPADAQASIEAMGLGL